METQNKDILLDDPLKEVTRKERKMLLGVSVLAIVLVKTGLVPTKISALGIEFSETHQQALLWVVSIVDIYFLFAFIIYAAADFFAWRKARIKELRAETKEHFDGEAEAIQEEEAGMYGSDRGEDYFESQLTSLKEKLEKYENQFRRENRKLKRWSWYVSVLRAIFEFGLPVIVGVYSILLLWFH